MSQSDIHLVTRAATDSMYDPPAFTLVAAPGYERLVKVFSGAHHQAAYGKGKERHANDLPFEKQKMLSISHLLDSADGMAYQVTKKLTEGLAMPEIHRTIAELYGAINYLAGIVVFLEDRQGEPGASMAHPATSDHCPTTRDNTHIWELVDAIRPGLGSYCTACLFRPSSLPGISQCSTCNDEKVVACPEGAKRPYKACPDCLL